MSFRRKLTVRQEIALIDRDLQLLDRLEARDGVPRETQEIRVRILRNRSEMATRGGTSSSGGEPRHPRS